MILERSELTDDPLMFSIEIATRSNTTLSRAARRFRDTNLPDMNDLMQNVYERITESTGARSVGYHHMNPKYTLHCIYKERHIVNDRFRMAFIRFRVSSHNLSIETGKVEQAWSGSATKRGASVCM